MEENPRPGELIR